MSWEWVILLCTITVGVLLIIFRKTTFVQQNWKYALILIPLAIFLILKIISDSKNKGDSTSAGGGKPNNEDLEKNIEKLKDKLEEVQMETAIEITAAKTKNEETIKQLEEIKAIEDKTERRKRLAGMIG